MNEVATKNNRMKKWFGLFIAAFILTHTQAQDIRNNPNSNHGNKFEQLGTILPSPNAYRTASGAPGPKYWQQRVDYTIACELDEKNLRLTGSETVTYFNNSPDILTYLWFQLDENEHSNLRNANYQTGGALPSRVSETQVNALEQHKADNGYGINIRKLTDAAGKALPYTINKTMMRVDLPVPLKPGQKYVLQIDWDYKISDRMVQNGRGGFEYFPGDGNSLFTMTQWYPRLCVYNDFRGWQNHQFTGRSEFALSFGNFNVRITAPADHIVGATGECQNYQQTLSPTQMSRWQQAQTAKAPLEIVTLAEAKAAEQKKSAQKKTWIFKADNVRDFAWTSSRKFVWDAMPIYIEGKKIMCMSFYGKEAYGLYSRYSTKVVAHTLRSYSRFSIPYPYPVAQSVEAANGMEYPMICFNYGRTEPDGSYSEATKNGMIGVIIHEVGHNFFPMIVNSDERQWPWMDEGLNSYLEYLTEQLWDNKFPSRRGPAFSVVDYMRLPKEQQEPIMTNPENIINLGPNVYTKTAAALNILRETIVGRELFDFAFKEYARRWAFKHPTPADFFRTIEDAAAEDLDWFWRGWFYSTDACDMAIDSVKYFIADLSAEIREGLTETTIRSIAPKPMLPRFDDISNIRNREDKNIVFETDKDSTLRDFYWKYARGLVAVENNPLNYTAPAYLEPLSPDTRQRIAAKHFYELSFSNKGGLAMPLIIEWTYADGTRETDRIPAQVWRFNENNLTKVFMKDKKVVAIKLDPMRETADIDESNNTWGEIAAPLKFTLYKTKQLSRGQSTGLNPMQAEKK